MNDDGNERDKPLAAVFLAQRKWIILCASFVYLVSHGWIALSQQWLFFQFRISENSIYLLKTIAFSGLIFATYMWASRYAFQKTHKLEQRRRFQELNIEERDIFSSRIEKLEEAQAAINEKINDLIIQISAAQQDVDIWDSRIHELESLFYSDFDIANEQISTDLTLYLEESQSRLSRNTIAASGVHSKASIKLALASAERSKEQAHKTFRIHMMAFESNEKEQSAISDQIADAVNSRTSILVANESEWKKFYKGRVISDLIACIPSALAVLYCASFLIFGNLDVLAFVKQLVRDHQVA